MEQIQYDVRPGEFADAMSTTQSARLLFWLVTGLTVMFQLAVFGLVDAGGVLDGERRAPAAAGENSPTSQAAVPPVAAPAPEAPTPKAAPPEAKSPPERKAPAPEAKSPPERKAPAPTKADGATKPEAAGAKAPPAADKTPQTAPAPPAPAPAASPPARKAAPPPPTRAEKWVTALRWSLPVARFAAMVSAMLLSLTVFFAVVLSLVGRLGGMSRLIGAFFWSLLLLAMVVPWQQVVPGSTLACGALYNLGELLAARAQWAQAEATPTDTLLYYGRFVAYPAAALLAWLVVHVKFVRACGRMHYPHALPSPVAGAERPAAPPTEEPAPPVAPPPRPAAQKSLAQRTLDEKSQAGAGHKPVAPDPGPAGALTERIIRSQSGQKPS